MVDSGDTGTSVIATDQFILYNKDINQTTTHDRSNWLTDGQTGRPGASLWINNEEHLYRTARIYGHSGYDKLIPYLQAFGMTNGDGLMWEDSNIDREEMDEMLEELCDNY